MSSRKHKSSCDISHDVTLFWCISCDPTECLAFSEFCTLQTIFCLDCEGPLAPEAVVHVLSQLCSWAVLLLSTQHELSTSLLSRRNMVLFRAVSVCSLVLVFKRRSSLAVTRCCICTFSGHAIGFQIIIHPAGLVGHNKNSFFGCGD